MGAHREMPIGVVGQEASDLSRLRQMVEASGGGVTVPIMWPDLPPSDVVQRIALFVLGTNADGPPDDVVGFLRARSSGTPLIVVGQHPARLAIPTLWLPSAPPAELFAAILAQTLREGRRDGPAPWRRKADMILGHSDQVKGLLHALDQLAPAQTPVSITGESGVGKELVARALHFCGPRARAPFVAINCGAIPETLFEAELFGYQKGAFTGAVSSRIGAFEAADKGTLFLDEIGELPTGMQVKLLRVLETSEVQRVGSNEANRVDFRLVSATNRDLEAEVRAGRFREDLFYRIHVYPLHIPPLRERPEDIPPIVHHHLSLIAAREKRRAPRLTPAALEKLFAHTWPGNVRELVNLIERAVLLAGADDQIEAEHVALPSALSVTPVTCAPAPLALLPYREAKAKFELEYYSHLLRTADGNVSLAAKLGQKTRKEIYDALKRLGLDAAAFRSGN
jgi:two-component system, NtrC family, response regulator GlrR